MPAHDAQMLKGVLPLLLLHLLAVREDYGYQVVVRLREQGFEDLAEGTVYPALTRMESQGLLSSSLVRSPSGPARKYYRPTAAGKQALRDAREAWQDLVTSVAAVTAERIPS